MADPIRFWTLAVEETHNWDSEVLARNGIRAAFGLYLIKEGEGVHLCELTPSSAAEWLQNAFVMEDDSADWEDPEGLEHDNGGGDRVTYFPFVDVEKHDPRFLAGPLEIDPEELDPRPEYGQTLESEAWAVARDAWNANPDEPAVTWGATFDAWQAELAAKRRAAMVPPLAYRCGGIAEPLPLFYAAAVKMLPEGQPTAETDAAFRAMRWI